MLDLAIGEQMRPSCCKDENSEFQALLCSKADKGVVHPRQVCRAVVGPGQQHAQQQSAHRELAGAHALGKLLLDRLDDRFDQRVVQERLEAAERHHRGGPWQSRPTACCSVGLGSVRHEVAEALRTADPGRVHEGTKADLCGHGDKKLERSRERSILARSSPPASEEMRLARDVASLSVAASDDVAGTGKARLPPRGAPESP